MVSRWRCLGGQGSVVESWVSLDGIFIHSFLHLLAQVQNLRVTSDPSLTPQVYLRPRTSMSPPRPPPPWSKPLFSLAWTFVWSPYCSLLTFLSTSDLSFTPKLGVSSQDAGVIMGQPTPDSCTHLVLTPDP